MRHTYLIVITLLCIFACNQENEKANNKPMSEQVQTNLDAFKALLKDEIPAPSSVSWYDQTQNEFFNEKKVVAVFTLTESEANALKEQLVEVHDGDGEYLPGIVKDWFPEPVKANFHDPEGVGVMTSRTPEYKASDILKPPFSAGPAFIIGQYVLVIGQSI